MSNISYTPIGPVAKRISAPINVPKKKPKRGGGSAGPVVFESATSTSSSAPTASTTGTIPAGTIAGDLLIALLGHQQTINDWTLPSGWNLHSIRAVHGGNEISILWKAASGSDSDPTFTANPGSNTSYGINCVLLRLSGADTSAPIGAIQDTNSVSGTSHTLTGITTTHKKAMAVVAACLDRGISTGAFSGWTNSATERADTAGTTSTLLTSLGVATKELPTKGATGNFGVTSALAEEVKGVVFEIIPG